MKTFLTLVLLSLGIANAETKPNVLFLAVDDMNDWIGCLDGTAPTIRPRAITPNIDKLAARGVNFTNAHTAGVFCAPSRAAIFSGQFASTTGCYTSAHYFVNRPETEALQTSFAKGGYTTLGAGKLFHHPTGAIDQRDWTEFFLRTERQRERGWPLDSWSEETPFPTNFPASIYNQGRKVTGGLFLEWGAVPEGKEEQMADTMRVNWAVDQLKKKHDKPFFLACGIYAPHFPNYCPQKYFDLYNPEEIVLPPYKENDLDDLPEKMRKKKIARRNQHHRGLEELDAIDDAIHGYLACISYADAMMGRVLDALETSPYYDNTIVVLWSDHGYHHGEKGDWGKHTLWERTSNVPFIWAGPGVAEGAKTDVTVSLIDMYPTLAEMCELPPPAQKLEGTSIAKTLNDPSSATDRDIFLPYMEPGEYAIINRDWRYIRYGEDGEELYDLKNDPNEWTNLAGGSEHSDLKKEMQQLAPATFAPHEEKLNSRKDLVVEEDTFRWKKGAGNANPKSGYVPQSTTKNPKAAHRGNSSKNLVIDSSFEFTGKMKSPWKYPKDSFKISPAKKTDGAHSLQSGKGIERGVAARQNIAIPSNHPFEVSYHIYFQPGSKGNVVFDTLDRFDETAQVVMDAKKSGEWLSFTRQFNSGEHEDVTLRFFPGQDFSGGFYVDEVSLIDTSEKEEVEHASTSPASGKNILFIVCDDLNTHVSPSGYDPISTPNLAAFAKESMTFNRAFCQYPVCGPSRASFLNGLYPESSGVIDNKADIRTTRPGTVSMPQFFKESGYWTGSVGKVFHSPRHEHGEVAWDEFHRFENDELPVVTEARKKFEAESGSVEEGKNRKAWKALEKQAKSKLDAQTPPGYGPSGLTDAQHKDGKNAHQVATWLREKPNGDKPFFIACGIQKPHVPFLAPDKYFDQYPRESLVYSPDRPTLWDSLPKMAISGRFKEFGFELGVEKDSLRREYMQAYHACISFIDAQIGVVLETLKEEGLAEDTVVIFTSDHGYHLGDHFLWGKVTLFDIGAKVPFIVNAPGITKAGTTSEAMVELIDIYPTLADLSGLKKPGHLQGTSLVPLLNHPERNGKKEYAYSVVSRGQKLGYALRNQRWRYALWPDGEELYNLTQDPEEKNNLANKENQSDRLEEFRAALEEKRSEAADHRESYKAGSTHHVDASTLTGKIMCGYQGWFNCEGDGAELGWTHWAKNRKEMPGPGNVTVDLWPDVSEYHSDELFPTAFKRSDGSTAQIFSSHNEKTVKRHFKWMQEYGIDGAFLQRFANGLNGDKTRSHKDAVLSHVRNGAKETGRAFALMYDLSGLKKGETAVVNEDWQSLKALNVTEDATYLHHEGKPLVAVWGVGFNDDRDYTLQECRELIEFLKAEGCAVMLGIPYWWREGGRDSIKDPERLDVMALADVLSPWNVGRYRAIEQVNREAEENWRADLKWCNEHEIDFLPVTFPGFSWHNLDGDDLASIPREKGKFLWSQFSAAKKAKCEMIYVAMFDEVDEGTAIFKCTNDVPASEGVSLLGMEGLASDYYLRLVGAGGKLLRGEIENTEKIPSLIN